MDDWKFGALVLVGVLCVFGAMVKCSWDKEAACESKGGDWVDIRGVQGVCLKPGMVVK